MWLHGRGPNTRRAYSHDADRFAAFVGVGLQAVAVEDVQGFADELEASGLSAGSQGRALAAVKSLLSYAHRIGHTAYNVGAVVQLPATKDTLCERILTTAKVREAIDTEPNARNRLLMRLLYGSGARVSEACGLCWRDLQPRDDDGGQAVLYGKGGKTRSVRLPSALYRDLEARRGEADAPVFPGRNGALTASAVWRIVKAAGQRIGEPRLSPHWFRHACASHSLDNGANVAVVRDTLGHSSLATTSRYVHARPGDSAGMYLGMV
jgi:integrase/recombinase XerD